MTNQDEPVKEPCKLFKLLQDDVPDFCGKHFIPKVEWQKFCNNEQKCHDEYWRLVYRDKKSVNKRLEKLEEKID